MLGNGFWRVLVRCFRGRSSSQSSLAAAGDTSALMRDGDKIIISGGSTGRVELLSNNLARKSPYPGSLFETGLQDIAQEYSIYQMLGSHPRLVRVINFDSRSGLTLEYLPKGNLRAFLLRNNKSITGMQRRIWIRDIIESVGLLHDHQVIHGDIKAENFLLDAESRLRIIDFSGSTLPGKIGSALESVRFCLPRNFEEPSNAQSDLFALGSTIYEVLTGVQPYSKLDDDEVEKLYRQGKFVDTKHLELHEIMQSCWKSDFKTVDEVAKAVDKALP